MTNTDRLAQALRDLYQGYVNTLETGRQRIHQLGGDCDPLEVMEHSDPNLISARRSIAEHDALASLATAAVEVDAVSRAVYESAVQGRRDFREALRKERAQVAALTAQYEGLKLNDARYRFWRKHYRSQFAMVLPGATLRFDAKRPAIEAAGPDYEAKVDQALEAARTET